MTHHTTPMNLDDQNHARQMDPGDMLAFIDDLPDQLESGWAEAASQPLSLPVQPKVVVICGMGGSSISGELAASLLEDSCSLPISVCRDYTLPAYVQGPESLVIALSHSGTTEETLSGFQQAIDRGCSLIAVTGGEKLARMAGEAGGTALTFHYDSPPRAALGWLYGTLLNTLHRLGLAPSLAEDIGEAVAGLREAGQALGMDSPVDENKAKRIAGQLVGRIPVIWAGAGLLAPVARRWMTQINENSKSAAYFELMPELNHNTVVGIEEPKTFIDRVAVIQLMSRTYDHPRVTIRHKTTHKLYLQNGLLTEMLYAHGNSRLAQQMNLVQFGDYVSYYLAMAYSIDPTPIGPIDALKAALAKVK